MTDTITVREAFEVLERVLADPDCEPQDLEPGIQSLQRLLGDRKREAADRRCQLIEDGWKRWGRGYKVIFNPETLEWIGAVDGNGHDVPREERDAFRAFVEAESAARHDVIANDRWL